MPSRPSTSTGPEENARPVENCLRIHSPPDFCGERGLGRLGYGGRRAVATFRGRSRLSVSRTLGLRPARAHVSPPKAPRCRFGLPEPFGTFVAGVTLITTLISS